MKTLLLALLLALSFPSASLFSQIQVDQEMNGVDLGSFSKFLIEPEGWEKKPIYAGGDDFRFSPMEKSNFGFSKAPVWLLLPVENKSKSETKWVLSFPYALLDRVELYYIDANNRLQMQLSGDGIPTAQRSRTNRDISFVLYEAPESQRQYYIRIRSESSLQVNHYAYSFDAYEQATVYETMFYSLFFGSFIAMGLYNIAMAFSTRSAQFFYYSLLVILSVIREAYLAGMAYQLLWPESPVLNEYVGIYSMSTSIILANAFIISFLSLQKKSRILYYSLCCGSVLSLVYMVAQPFVGYAAVIRPLSLQVMLNSLLVILASVIQWHRGFQAARFLTIAWVFALAGWMITSVAAYGIIPYSVFTKYANPLGQFLEIIFLSFALAESINALRKEKNRAIIALNKGLEKEVKEKTQDIQSILDSIPLGILKIDGSSRIKNGHSKFIETLIQTSLDQPAEPIILNGRSLNEIILSRSNLSRDEIAVIMNVISASVNDSQLQWLCNVGLLPTEIIFQEKIFELLWTPIYSDSEEVIKEVLLVIKDVTDLRITELENEKTHKENQIILGIIKTREKDFASFTRTFDASLSRIRKIVLKDESLWLKDDIDEAWRLLHTLKGISRSLGFKDISAMIHDVESQLRSMEKPWPVGGTSYFATLRGMLDNLVSELAEYKRIDRDVLKRSSDQHLEVSVLEITQQVTYLENLQRAASIRAEDLTFHINQLKGLYRDTLSKIADNQLRNLEKIAEGLGKPLPRLHVEDLSHFFDDAMRDVLETILIHLIRNSLDHGIEIPAERSLAGKPPRGVITILLEEHNDHFQIIYRDDGRGLRLEKIKARAVAMGLLAEGQALAADEIAKFVFQPHFSTTEKVTEISGRGVGMNAVQEAIRSFGGSIDILLDSPARGLDSGQIFQLNIQLPKGEQLSVSLLQSG